jgi:hypothetical protein
MNKFTSFFAASFFVISIPIFSLSGMPAASAPTAVNSGVSADTSLNWSGYVASQGTFTSVSGTWTVPSVANTAAQPAADATWVGIGGVSSHDLIQAGTQAITNSGSGNNVTYQAWYELLPSDMQTISLPVHAGDSVSVSLAETSSNVWTISFTNHTTGSTYTTNVNYNSSLSSAEWIEEMPTANIGFIPLDNFGSVSFSGASAVDNGDTVTIAGANAQAISMITQGNQTLATPSALGSDGASFTVTRTSATATAPAGVARTQYFVGGSHWRVGVPVNHYTPASNSPATGSVTSVTIPASALPWFRLFERQGFQNLQTQFSVRFGGFRAVRF